MNPLCLFGHRSMVKYNETVGMTVCQRKGCGHVSDTWPKVSVFDEAHESIKAMGEDIDKMREVLDGYLKRGGRMMLLALLLTSPLAADQHEVKVTVLDVYDGDSITVSATRVLVSEDGAVVLQSQAKVRVCCMDTPELGWRAKCPKEQKLGAMAKQTVKGLIGQTVTLHVQGLEKFGRVLARVEMEAGGMLDDSLIRVGMAKPYEGEARDSWCTP